MLNRLGEVFASFHKHKVKYLVIGGIAAVLHGVPRATFDLDILIEATEDNAQRTLEAMIEARLGTATLISAQELLAKEITIFQDRIRIDVQTKTPGIEFETAWQSKETMTVACDNLQNCCTTPGQQLFGIAERQVVGVGQIN